MRGSVSAILAAAAALAVGIGGDEALAQAQSKPKLHLGSLSCNVSGGGGFIFGSTKELTCVYMTDAGKSALYHGSIDSYGINIGNSNAIHTVWHVFTLGSDHGVGALAGGYVGSNESLSLGTGAGGAILIGGLNSEIVLQAAAIEQNAGFNFAEGLTKISLNPGR